MQNQKSVSKNMLTFMLDSFLYGQLYLYASTHTHYNNIYFIEYLLVFIDLDMIHITINIKSAEYI